jgi:hypothetical protein
MCTHSTYVVEMQARVGRDRRTTGPGQGRVNGGRPIDEGRLSVIEAEPPRVL